MLQIIDPAVLLFQLREVFITLSAQQFQFAGGLLYR